MEGLSAPNLLCNWQRLAVAPFEQKPEAYLLRVRCYDAKHHDWGWMLGCWHSAVFRHHSQMLWYDHSVCWRQDQRWMFSHREKWEFDSRDSSGHSTNGYFSLFFIFCVNLVTFWNVSFSNAFMIASWLITWGIPDRGESFRALKPSNVPSIDV